MPGWLIALFGKFVEPYIAARLKLPQSAYAEIEADSAQYNNGTPLTAEQLQAADAAIVDYIMGKVMQAVP